MLGFFDPDKPKRKAAHVLITDVDQRVGLHATRVLGRMGLRITGTSLGPSSGSRYLEKTVTCRHSDLADWIEGAQEKDPFDLVLPISINACWSLQRALAEGRDLPKVMGFRAEMLERANDKLLVVEAAARCGVAAPRTVAVSDSREAEAVLCDFPLPAVLKLRNDIGTYLAPRNRYFIVRKGSEVAGTASSFPPGLPLLVQEYVPGPGGGAGLLIDDRGEIRCRIAYRRVREYPLSGGPSTLACTVRDESLLDAAGRLIRELSLRDGVAHVEFKLTDRGPVVMEVNPRLWGTVCLAEYAGQPLIQRWVLLALGAPSPRDLDFEAGVMARSLVHDLKGGLAALRRFHLAHVFRVARDLFRPGIRPMVFAGDDLRVSAGILLPARWRPAKVCEPARARRPQAIGQA